MPLDLIFCGTPRFAVPTLEKLQASGHRIHLVVTQPDRPKGRGLELVASPVKESALKLNLPITQPDRIKTNDEFRAQTHRHQARRHHRRRLRPHHPAVDA